MRWLLPPVLWALCLVAMVVQWRWLAVHGVLPRPFHFVGLALIAAGLLMMLWAAYQFHARKTNIKPFHDPDILVTNGIYGLTRNPMYLGLALSLLGFALLLNDLGSLVFVAVFVVVANSWYIPFEERAAERKFGDAYDAYRGRVRRWI